jgi:hypothetical protein
LCPAILADRTAGQKAGSRNIAADFSLGLISRAQLARIELIRHLVFSSFDWPILIDRPYFSSLAFM